MKKVEKFFMAALLAGMCSFGYAQDYMYPPKSNERVVTSLNYDYYEYVDENTTTWADKQAWYKKFLSEAQRRYPNEIVEIRDLKVSNMEVFNNVAQYRGPASCKVVINWDYHVGLCISQAIGKSLNNVRNGARLAIDQVTVPYTMDRNDFKDEITALLLNNGYKVIAKENFEKLYQEQQDQQSGIYNDRTTVQENNFSAVGYFLNIKLTETSVRVQVVNVSTGEYEGNSTVNF